MIRFLPRAWLAALAAPFLALPPAPAHATTGSAESFRVWQFYAARSHEILTSLNRAQIETLPAPPAGVTQLDFSEFFGPVGDRGLEYSAQIRRLDGQRVRLTGYRIREQQAAPGVFLLAGLPQTVEAKALCSTDTVPASIAHVIVPSSAHRALPYSPGRLVLIGRLEVGPRLESDGRNSTVRLVLDPATAAQLWPASGQH